MRRRDTTGGGNGTRPGRAAAEAALATVDRALATGEANAADGDERRLEQLALALRAEAPRPSDDFARRMDARVAGGFAAARSGRRGAAGRVERSAQIALAAPGDELHDVAAGIASVAERNGGVLTDSSLTTGAGGRGGGSFELQVPVDRLSATLAELSELASVRSLTQAGNDLTVRFVRRGETVDELRTRLDELQADLAVADDDEHDAIRAEIRSMRREIRAAERALDRVRERTAFATIDVTLVEGEERETGLGAALEDGVDLLEDALGIGIRALGILIPLGLLMAIAWWLAGLVRRRQRESALA